jgi:hypothetical protein
MDVHARSRMVLPSHFIIGVSDGLVGYRNVARRRIEPSVKQTRRDGPVWRPRDKAILLRFGVVLTSHSLRFWFESFRLAIKAKQHGLTEKKACEHDSS